MALQYNYLISARAVKNGVFRAEPGKARYLKVPAKVKVPSPAMEVDVKTWMSEVRALAVGRAPQLHGRPSSTTTAGGDVLMFVHGYANDLDIIMQRQRRLQTDLAAEGWCGVVVSFDWPSANSTLNYLEDRSDAADVAIQLVSHGIVPMALGQLGGCDTNVHLLGHSTGAFVIVEACAAAEKRGDLFKTPWRIGQCAFIAGDVSSDTLSACSAWSAPMYSRIMRLTNYSNPFDRVLAISNAKRLGAAPRAGRVGLFPPPHGKAINVNCGRYFASLDQQKQAFYGTFNHSWHIGSRVFARDLAMTLEGGIDRNAIPTRKREGGELILAEGRRPLHERSWDMERSPNVP